MGRIQRLTRCIGQHRVVGAGVAINGDAVERALHGPAHHRLPSLSWNPSIATEKSQHRGHIGVDHSRAFGHPANPHRSPPQIGHQSHLLLNQISGEDGRSRSSSSLHRPIKSIHQRFNPSQEGFHRNGHTNHAGGADQHLLLRQAEVIGNSLGGPLAIDQPAITGAGIGLA